MEEARAVRDALDRSLGELEPPSFRGRVTAAAGERPLLPGALTVRVARTVDPAADIEAAAARGAGVQLCYEGLELTRSVLRDRPWEGADTDGYYRDLLVAEVLVSRGFHLLADTGVVRDVVAIVRQFGRTQTELGASGRRRDEDPLEVDVLELAVNAGVDFVMDGSSASVRARSGDIARDLLEHPLPGPEALSTVDDQIAALATDVLARTNR